MCKAILMDGWIALKEPDKVEIVASRLYELRREILKLQDKAKEESEKLKSLMGERTRLSIGDYSIHVRSRTLHKVNTRAIVRMVNEGLMPDNVVKPVKRSWVEVRDVKDTSLKAGSWEHGTDG